MVPITGAAASYRSRQVFEDAAVEQASGAGSAAGSTGLKGLMPRDMWFSRPDTSDCPHRTARSF